MYSKFLLIGLTHFLRFEFCPYIKHQKTRTYRKSLSLACSALAWLKYCEQRDLACTSNTSTDNPVPSTSSLNENQQGNDDWWNAWVPPETTQKEQDWKDTRQTATKARQELQNELDLWRSKIYGDGATKDRAHQRRENFARSAVTVTKMAEKVGRKRVKRTKTKAELLQQQQRQQQQEDYCLDDYNSDNDCGSRQVGEDDDSDTDDDTKRSTELGGACEDHKKVASQLLNGHRLDGSYRDSNRHRQYQQQQKLQSNNTIANVVPGSGVRKIIYAARTHSQLSQFVGELQRTAWGDKIKVVALGSRQLLCGNKQLKKLHPTESSLTEACLDLKQGKVSTSNINGSHKASTVEPKKRSKNGSSNNKTSGCPLLESKEAVSTLGLHLLTTPSDIEDAARLGSASHTCAYYASRNALTAAEVVVLPYSMLLSKPTRDAIGLSLKGSLVVVDEAHNLPEALRQLNSSQLSLPVVKAAMQQLTRYTQAYAQRLAGRNLMYLGNLRKLLQAFAKHLNDGGTNFVNAVLQQKENSNISLQKSSMAKKRALLSTGEFLLELKLDNINLFKLLRYLERSRLSQKLLGFTSAKNKDDEIEQAPDDAGLSKHVSAMSIVQTFLEKLNLKGQEGKVVTDWPALSVDNNSRVQHPTLRYVLLHPASCFDNVLDEAHALALVGGTLAPFGHVAAELLASEKQTKGQTNESSFLHLASKADASFKSQVSSNDENDSSNMSFVSSQFAAFTCDHVVPSSNVLVKCLSFGPGGQRKFDFRHQSRMSPDLCQELGSALLNIAKVVPNGLVVFLPSYSYEAHLVSEWQKSGLWNQLNDRKKIFREPKSAQRLEFTLRMFADVASKDRMTSKNATTNEGIGGALLLAVIGGKMSEGINLANEMARGVVIVGLPYPDITDPELQEKMAMMEKHGVGGLSGRDYYQNLCMRAVNQSIGRAIRHASDYASIFLCDYRYATQQHIWSRLPKWLRNAAGGQPPQQGRQTYPSLEVDLEYFFRHKTCNKSC